MHEDEREGSAIQANVQVVNVGQLPTAGLSPHNHWAKRQAVVEDTQIEIAHTPE